MKRIGVIALIAAMGAGAFVALRHWPARAADRGEVQRSRKGSQDLVSGAESSSLRRPGAPTPRIGVAPDKPLAIDWTAANRLPEDSHARHVREDIAAYRDLVARGHLTDEQQAKIVRVLLDAQMNERETIKADVDATMDRARELEQTHFGDPSYMPEQATEEASRELIKQHALLDGLHSINDQSKAAARQALTPEQYRLFERAFPLPSINVLPIQAAR
jgi:hypothetical protein